VDQKDTWKGPGLGQTALKRAETGPNQGHFRPHSGRTRNREVPKARWGSLTRGTACYRRVEPYLGPSLVRPSEPPSGRVPRDPMAYLKAHLVWLVTGALKGGRNP